MSIVILQLPNVRRSTQTRPRTCPDCQVEFFQRWGTGQKRLRDPHLRGVSVYRYCCCHCQRLFFHNPEGVDCAEADRLAQIGVSPDQDCLLTN